VIYFYLLVIDSLISTLTEHEDFVSSVSFDADGLLASGSDDKTIKLWNTKTRECLRTLKGHENSVESVGFDGDGLLASGSDDKTIKLWN
jgi:WD40 repeat protein